MTDSGSRGGTGPQPSRPGFRCHDLAMDRTDWDARWRDKERNFTDLPNATLVAEAAALVPGRALDLACGAGRNTVWLAEHGWRATGVDFSTVALAHARERAAARGVEVEWLEEDVREWQPPAAAFDVVLVGFLQTPEDELRAALERAASAVAPGGVLLAIGHDRANLDTGAPGPRDPARLWTPDAIASIVRSAGLEVERADRAERQTEKDGVAVTAIDTVVRARRPA